VRNATQPVESNQLLDEISCNAVGAQIIVDLRPHELEQSFRPRVISIPRTVTRSADEDCHNNIRQDYRTIIIVP
jgi:hypothetical protein